MARIITSGAELLAFDGQAGVEGLSGGSVAATFDTTVKRSGRASFKCAVTGSGASAGPYWQPASNQIAALGNTIYARFYLYMTAIPSAGTFLAQFSKQFGGSPELAVVMNSSGQVYLQCRGSGSYVNVDSNISSALTLNAWHRIDVSLNVPSSGNGSCGLSLDGGVVTPAGTSANVGNTIIGGLSVGVVYSGASTTVWIDDVAVNDSTGSSENGAPNPNGRVIYLPAVADSAGTGFTAGGNTIGLWGGVDNTPPIGVAAASATSGSQIVDANNNATDSYTAACAAPASQGMGNSDNVMLAQAVCSHGSSGTTSRTDGISGISPAITEVTGTTGTTAAGTWPTGWSTLVSAPVYAPGITNGQNPTVRFRKGSASTDSSMASAMGLLMEYVSVAPAATTIKKLHAGVWQ